MMMCLTFLISPLPDARSAVPAVRTVTTRTASNNRHNFMFSSFRRYCVNPPCMLNKLPLNSPVPDSSTFADPKPNPARAGCMGDMSNRAAVSPYLLKPRGPRPSPPNRNQASALCRQNEGPTTRDNNGGLAGALLVSATNEEIL